MDVEAAVMSLRRQVEAAWTEFNLATKFHEAWKPTAYDEDLHERMGSSYATNTFLTIRLALRREMLLSLMRLWDDNRSHIRIASIGNMLKDRRVLPALAAVRFKGQKFERGSLAGQPVPPVIIKEWTDSLEPKAARAIAIIDKYAPGNSHASVLDGLRQFRHEHLAHHQVTRTVQAGPEASREEIDAFYLDMAELISVLLSLVLGTVFSPAEAGDVERHYAKRFWAPACGEKTEGHPKFKQWPPKP